jgi:hypothetical protein
LLSGDLVMQGVEPELTEMQQRVLRLLGVSEQVLTRVKLSTFTETRGATYGK